MNDLGRLLAHRYRLTDILGQGGMGAVWRAHDEQLNRDVAVKELRFPEQLSADRRQTWIARLDREARAAARLKHPGIITVHDLVVGDDERPWIIMELVHGRSLGDLLNAEGALPPQRVACIGLRILDALRAAHQVGVVHRDVKPANVLLEGDRVVLTDFGIAAVDNDATLTRSGEIMGTPAFMSPEQVRGLPAGPASDLWSLGATLYTAVEGRPPFGGTSAGAVFVAVATEDPAAAVHAGPLEPVISALLRKDPARRPTGDQLHAALTRLGPGHPAHGPAPAPAPAHQPPQRPPAQRGRPPWLVPAAIAATVVAAAAVFAFVFRSGADSTYNDNLRIAESLGAPSGYTRTAEKNIGGGRAQVTLTADRTCGAECSASDGHAACQAVREWLQTRPAVKSVSLAIVTPDGRSCVFGLQPVHTPGVIKAEVLLQNDRTLVRIEAT
ncbi:serine/threonine-protein kinase [Actinoallomurus acaciae]|uniref:non-specific serine/threonine protein kinase n=1 Tax=Actinoallomurus acaciae TaxID=502577 RepID=A0ABV5YSQ2_9ACTN